MGNFSPDFNFQFTNLLFLLIPLVKAIYDVVYRENKGKAVKHNLELVIFLVIGALVALVDYLASPVLTYLQPAALGIAIQWLVFDYLRNIIAGEHIFYVDTKPESDAVEDSKFDTKLYARFNSPLMWLFIKAWVFLTAFGLYYYAELL